MSNILKEMELENLYKKELLLKKAEIQLGIAKQMFDLKVINEKEYVEKLCEYDVAISNFKI